jgi:hypothetical protein
MMFMMNLSGCFKKWFLSQLVGATEGKKLLAPASL